MFQLHPIAILAFIAVAMSWSLAIVLYRVGMPGSAARKLSLLLFLEGLTLGSADAGVVYWIASPDVFYAENPWFDTLQGIVHTLGDVGMLALYPPFLAAALNTKFTRPFLSKKVQVGLFAGAALLFAGRFVTPFTVGLTVLFFAMAVTFLYALVASINAWRIATGAARTRGFIFALAFGFRDICWAIVYSLALWGIWTQAEFVPDDAVPMFHSLVYISGTMVAVPLIAYGILRTQLFDIELKIQWTIKQSTLAAIIVTIIFLVSEGADRLLSAELGNWVGLLGAALVVFFLAPLQNFADRVASAAMPNTENTPEYIAHRKMLVYEAALAEARQEDGISDKERSLLNHLRDSLGISPADAEALERDLQQAQGTL